MTISSFCIINISIFFKFFNFMNTVAQMRFNSNSLYKKSVFKCV